MKQTNRVSAATMTLLEQRLRQLRGDLAFELEGLESDAFEAERGAPDRQADESVDSYAQESDVGLLECNEGLLREVVDALERIQQETYGLCESCEEPIPTERLTVLPYARYCTPCATESEAKSS